MDKKNEKVPMKEEEPEVNIGQTIIDREISIENTENNIRWISGEVKFKEDQLKKEIVEENISELYKLVSFPLNHKKPEHVLKIEIEMLKKGIKAKNESLKIMRELQIGDIKKLEVNNATKPNKSKQTCN